VLRAALGKRRKLPRSEKTALLAEQALESITRYRDAVRGSSE
jgi:hypothetical protein